MPIAIPQSRTFLSFLDRYNRDFETTEDYENIHEFSFDPQVSIGDTDKLRYGELFEALSDINEGATGNKINISRLPDVTESIHLIDGNVRRQKKNYWKWRGMIRDVAEQSDEFKYDLPEKNKKQFIDKHAKEMYGIYRILGTLGKHAMEC